MERLTTRSVLGGWTLKVPRQEAVDRLAAYEDTGLEPEEVAELKSASELERKVGSIAGENLDRIIRSAEAVLAHIEDREELQAYRALGPVEELAALVKVRDEGLLLEMPCKPGTELFGHCDIRGANPISRGYFRPPHIPKLGVDAWLTRAEAEAALGGGGDG